MTIGGGTLPERLPNEVSYDARHWNDPYALDLRLWDAAAGWIATPVDLLRLVMRVDGLDGARNILRPETIVAMTASSPANPLYARGWRLDRAGGWYHTGYLPGVSAVVARSDDGMCWAACVNTRDSDVDAALPRLMAAMARRVGWWCT